MAYTDYYSPYKQIIPRKIHKTKSETYTIEGYNNLLRHLLARVRRKTKCYSKCEKMLDHSIRFISRKKK